jgi:hypothetical protein
LGQARINWPAPFNSNITIGILNTASKLEFVWVEFAQLSIQIDSRIGPRTIWPAAKLCGDANWNFVNWNCWGVKILGAEAPRIVLR